MSGSFTINGDPTVPPGASPTGSPWNTTLLSEGGSDVSLTVNLGPSSGWQVLNYSNSPSNPWAAQANVSVGYPGGSTSDTLLAVTGLASDNNGSSYKFSVDLLVPAAKASLANLRTFGTPLMNVALPGGTSDWGYSVDPYLVESRSGTLTSVRIVSTPEPSSIVIFTAIAVAAMIQARRGRPGRFARP